MTAFIILNYNNYNDSALAIRSILQIENEQYIIILVDNASSDDSYEQLMDTFSGNQRIEFIKNDENLGFSRGNNVGCEHAINNYPKLKFLCVFNNDIFINDSNFLEKLEVAYQKADFDILAPQIWNTRKNYNQNPFKVPANKTEAENKLNALEKSKRVLQKYGGLIYYIRGRLSKIRYTGTTAHGAAIIFSAKYFQQFTKVFPELSFMYGEESFIYYRVQKHNLIIAFDNGIKTFHSDSSSTRKILKGRKKKWVFQNEHMCNAAEKLVELYANDIDC